MNLAATLTRIAASYEVESDKAYELDLSKELGILDRPIRRFGPDIEDSVGR
jgi:hypothetical protein